MGPYQAVLALSPRHCRALVIRHSETSLLVWKEGDLEGLEALGATEHPVHGSVPWQLAESLGELVVGENPTRVEHCGHGVGSHR